MKLMLIKKNEMKDILKTILLFTGVASFCPSALMLSLRASEFYCERWFPQSKTSHNLKK
jgi:hypothetical protein